MRNFLIALSFLITSCFVHAQQEKADSLIKIASQKEGTEKAKLYNDAANIIMGYNPQKALQYAEKALDISTKAKNVDEAYFSMLTIGNAYYEMGRYQEVLETDLEILELYGDQINDSRLAQLHTQIGNDYQLLKNYNKAIEHLLRSMEIIIKSENKESKTLQESLMVNHTNTGIIFTELENYEKAREHFDKAMELSKQFGDSTQMMFLYNNMGIIFQRQNKYKQAIESYSSAQQLMTKYGSKANNTVLLLNMSKVYALLGEEDKALEVALHAIRMAEELGDENKIAKLSNNIADIYLKTNQSEKAIPHIRKSLELGRKNNYIEVMNIGYNLLSKFYASKGNYREAYLAKEKFAGLKDSLYDVEMASRITEIQTRFETEKKEQEIELLKKNAEIQDLKIRRQQTFNYALGGMAFLIAIAGILGFSREKEKQKRIRSEMGRKHLETEQKLLRAQINPHFMFNALNSVQSYISGNDNLKAMSFLAKFSQLMRSILENSRKSMVSLEEEINTLTLYMELEAMRFKNTFDFQIRVDKKLRPSKTFIPPMLVQPFVENAVKHAFRDLDKKGKLTIDFNRENGTVHCVVEDNGVGRAKSLNQKRGAGKQHVSLGMQVTRERLETLKSEKKSPAGFEVTDLKSAEGKASGTRVNITMPYETE